MNPTGQLHLVPNQFTGDAFAPVGADTLAMRVGHASAAGRRDSNEDFVGLVTPKGTERAAKGVLAAVADGVSGGHGGRDAAEYTVRSLLSDYYATPDTWSVPLALDRVLTAANRWLLAQGAARSDLTGMACTLSALVLRGARYHLAHVGDTRIYRLRGKELQQLTQDHVWDRPDMQHVLKRAVGLDRHLTVDYSEGEVLGNDVFLICSDGVWEPLGQARIQELLQIYADPQIAAQEFIDSALRAGGQDNASAIELRVDAVSPHSWKDLLGEGLKLPVPPRLKAGSRIDEFEVLELIHESRATLLYRVRSQRSGQVFALKTLQPLLADDAQSCEGLLAEEWLAKRLVSPLFAQVVPLAASARNFLYYVMSYHTGRSLQQALDDGAHFDVSDITRIGIQVAKGLGALHRLSILHRDIKPGNLLQEAHGSLRVLDLGVALAAGVPYPELSGNPGTPSYMAPELFEGKPASVQSDLYAAGTTLYHLLTRHYPYGEIEPFQSPRFGDPVRPTRYRPDIPQWLEIVLLRAVARDPAQRFETAEELLTALERGDRYSSSAPLSTPLMHRDRATRWQAFAIGMLLVNLLLLYLLLIG